MRIWQTGMDVKKHGSERKAEGKKPHAWVERETLGRPWDREAAIQRTGRGEPNWPLLAGGEGGAGKGARLLGHHTRGMQPTEKRSSASCMPQAAWRGLGKTCGVVFPKVGFLDQQQQHCPGAG